MIKIRTENKIIIGLLIVIIILISIDIFTENQVKEKNNNEIEVVVEQEEIVPYYTEKEAVDIVDLKRTEYETKLKELQTIEDEQERFVAYKKLYDEYLEWCDFPETIYDCYSEEEILLIQKVVETETFQCDFMSKVNVANVIFNRVISEEFDNSITEVVTKPNQFAYGRNNISESTILAVEYAFLNEDTTNGSLFFHSNSKTETFNKAEYVFTDDCGHHFYKR